MKRRACTRVCQADKWPDLPTTLPTKWECQPRDCRRCGNRTRRLWDTRLIERSTTGLAGFNAAPATAAEQELLSCCASRQWARQVAAGRPYRDLAALLAAAQGAIADLPWSQIERALAAHPRIGDRVSGEDRAQRWSRSEQAGMANAGTATRAALVEANREYERRFGHVLLIFASGRSDTELLAAARERLGNDPDAERRLVRTELGKIAQLRLKRLVE
jgi:2-oxo-4-hydroxy-4-carboxy-5-ureidoimidazoline decarboxylase